MPPDATVMSVSESLLPLVLIVPLLAAVLVLLGAPARKTSVWATAINLGIVLLQTFFYRGRFSYTAFQVVPSLDMKFLVGMDGLSLMMVLLTAIVTLSAVWVSPKVAQGENAFYACLLFISAGAIGAFISFDLFFFYAFHELALIPTFLLIGIWGHGENRVAAAWKITIYLALGSFVLLLGLIGLYLNLPEGHRTFDLNQMVVLQNTIPHAVSPRAQRWIFPLLLAGFGTLISLFPFHTWAAPAYAAAPTPAAMLHSGVLKKFGLYGLLRVALPLLPEGMQHWMPVLLVLLVGNIIYVGFVTIAQKRLDMMLGYSSVMHMGYIFLGISSLNLIGLSGAAMMMFAHGLSIAALFAVAGEVRARTGTMRMDELGGLARTMPRLALLFGLGMFASIGLPGFANFASETMVFFGAFSAEAGTVVSITKRHLHFDGHQIATVCGLWGVVMSAVYMLRGYRRVFLGEANRFASDALSAETSAATPSLADLTDGRRWAVAILVIGLVVVGFQPRTLLDSVRPAIALLMPLREVAADDPDAAPPVTDATVRPTRPVLPDPAAQP